MEAAQIPDNAIPFQGILFSSGGNPALGRVGIGGGEGGVTNGVATGGGTTVVVAGVEATTGAGVGVVVAAGAVPTTGAGAGGGAEARAVDPGRPAIRRWRGFREEPRIHTDEHR